ncbi:MAG: flagellar biosynthetic protein FliR [Gammaproteobacteria bacterium]|nr:MAG: flagellar biosynthetic protein FliR [Gammaproteobacteria bacterium]
MNALLSSDQLFTLLQGWYWPFLRLSALFMIAPIFGASSFPRRARILLAVAIASIIAPTLPAVQGVDPMSAAGVLMAGEQVLIGLAMGFILQTAFAALVMAGQALAMTMGLGFAMSVDPQNGVQVPVLSQFYMIVATLLFLAIDGHLMMIEALAHSFTLLPPGQLGQVENLAMNIVRWGSQMFASALLIALPALTAALLINVSFGVITRAAPQLNIFAVGFPVTISVGFVFIMLSMPPVIKLLEDIFHSTLGAALAIF